VRVDASSTLSSYDAVVIGGGPAGCVAARSLALRGAMTLLVDKAVFPRMKVCGGCLSPKAVASLIRLGLGKTIEGAGEAQALRVLWSERSVCVTVPRRVVVDRADFDMALAEAASQAGAALMLGCGARVNPGGTVILRDHSDQQRPIHAKVVIVADGLGGTAIREDPRFQWQVSPKSAIGIGGVVSAATSDRYANEIVMSCSCDGYAGLATLGDGRRVVAGASRSPGSGGAAGTLISLLGPLADGVDLSCGVRGVPQLTRVRSSVEADGRVFVIGDAAGYVEPFTGEGMSWAIEHAELVVGFARRVLDGSYEPGSWAACLHRIQQRQKRVCRVVSGVLRRPRVGAMVVGALGVFPAWGEAAAELVGGSSRSFGGVR
jgi:flavin-dependent dehydrogenase